MQNTIDDNTRNVGLGYVQGTDDMILPFRCNAMGELLIEVIPIGSPLANLDATTMAIDDNTKNTHAGVSSANGQTIIPLTADVIVTLPCVRAEAI